MSPKTLEMPRQISEEFLGLDTPTQIYPRQTKKYVEQDHPFPYPVNQMLQSLEHPLSYLVIQMLQSSENLLSYLCDYHYDYFLFIVQVVLVTLVFILKQETLFLKRIEGVEDQNGLSAIQEDFHTYQTWCQTYFMKCPYWDRPHLMLDVHFNTHSTIFYPANERMCQHRKIGERDKVTLEQRNSNGVDQTF
ncbi:uncharacterized protein LOC111087639 [Limulus polyphemus]|uniref:Uncharacterized protein LOC111087639 n=1 Tax=Limulus polyphemus TaxID=6850 RepID=A0ABM1T469_LIMPO|nr:uncharacterized protein LOC111087639 [Limulus polyphemus]